jgi:hypothetical protein
MTPVRAPVIIGPAPGRCGQVKISPVPPSWLVPPCCSRIVTMSRLARPQTTGNGAPLAAEDLAYALRKRAPEMPRTALNNQRSAPAPTCEHEASAGFKHASNAR